MCRYSADPVSRGRAGRGRGRGGRGASWADSEQSESCIHYVVVSKGLLHVLPERSFCFTERSVLEPTYPGFS